ncbi:MAG: hypothetical protein HDR21_14035 [Lachnospiraceae bacterium]|nr:hypothetical protein [Lachnospiraceae bacterium]
MENNNTGSGIIYMNAPIEGPKPLEATPRLDFDSNLLTTEDASDALYAATRRLGAALGETSEALVEVFHQIAKKASEVVNATVRPLSDFFSEYFNHQEELRSVATPRQWDLYLHGKPRVSKKWEHVFKKRLAKQKKGRRTHR